MATYIVDSTGSNNAELIGDFTTSDVAQTVTFNSGTDGEAKPLKALETTRAWLVVEAREVNGTAGVIGKHVYSEDVTDIQTRVEAIRQDMIALHSTFVINCTHYKTNSVCDVYRGDEATVVALSAGDTNITFTPPAVWVIDDLTKFSPTTPVGNVNLVIDSGCDNAGEWERLNTGWSISGSELVGAGVDGGHARPNLSAPLEAGATYTVSCDCTLHTTQSARFYLGATASGFFGSTGHKSFNIVCPTDGTYLAIQGVSSMTANFDNISCIKV